MFGERLQEIRKEHGYSQQQLANHLHISVYTVSSYERGKSIPDDEKRVAIAKLFDISLDYLFGLTNVRCSYVKGTPHIAEENINNILKYANLIKKEINADKVK